MKKLYIFGGAGLLSVLFIGYLYTAVFLKGDAVNQIERKAFIEHGSDKFEVTIFNGNGVSKVYQAVSKVTSEPTKGYYYFWAQVNGHRVYVQSPMGLTLIEEK